MENVVNILPQRDLLDLTDIFFSSHNGFRLGQFGLPVDKRQLYEFDIRVPMMARGPMIRPGQVSQVADLLWQFAYTFSRFKGTLHVLNFE
nr:hypothetical protein BaRGS_016309 [Batillaria attramentaria]